MLPRASKGHADLTSSPPSSPIKGQFRLTLVTGDRGCARYPNEGNVSRYELTTIILQLAMCNWQLASARQPILLSVWTIPLSYPLAMSQQRLGHRRVMMNFYPPCDPALIQNQVSTGSIRSNSLCEGFLFSIQKFERTTSHGIVPQLRSGFPRYESVFLLRIAPQWVIFPRFAIRIIRMPFVFCILSSHERAKRAITMQHLCFMSL